MNVARMLVKNNTLKMCYEKVKTNETRYSRDTLNKQGREEMRMQLVVLCVAIWEPYKQGSITVGGFQWRLILSKQSAYADTEGLGSVNYIVKKKKKKTTKKKKEKKKRTDLKKPEKNWRTHLDFAVMWYKLMRIVQNAKWPENNTPWSSAW